MRSSSVLAKEAVDQTGPVLHPFDPGLHRASSTASISPSGAVVSLHRAPHLWRPAPAFRRPQAPRHRFADIRCTRNRRATSRSLAPASISSAAASRTRSRRHLDGQPAAVVIPHGGVAQCARCHQDVRQIQPSQSFQPLSTLGVTTVGRV